MKSPLELTRAISSISFLSHPVCRRLSSVCVPQFKVKGTRTAVIQDEKISNRYKYRHN